MPVRNYDTGKELPEYACSNENKNKEIIETIYEI